MKLNTINLANNHAEVIREEIRSADKVPFVDVLSEQSIKKKLAGIKYRERAFPPDLTVFAFLSQVMEADQSCQNTVARIIAHLARQKKRNAICKYCSIL